MRPFRVGVASLALAALMVAGATAAHAYWSRSLPAPAPAVTSGSLGVTAVWQGAAWTPPFPGQSTDATLVVTGTGTGDTLRWALTLSPTVAPGATSWVSIAAWSGACGTGTVFSLNTPQGSYAPGAQVSVCLRVTLAAGAPQSLMGASLLPTLTVSATQRTS